MSSQPPRKSVPSWKKAVGASEPKGDGTHKREWHQGKAPADLGAGKTKKNTGKATGDKKLKVKGKAEELVGKVKGKGEKAKRAAK